MRRLYLSVPASFVVLAVFFVVGYLTQNFAAGFISCMAVMVCYIVRFFVWGCTLRCPSCNKRRMRLVPDIGKRPVYIGVRKYYVRCPVCKTELETDLVEKQMPLYRWYARCGDEGMENKPLMSKADWLYTLFIILVSSGIAVYILSIYNGWSL